MKKLILSLMMIGAIYAKAQVKTLPENADGTVEYKSIVEVKANKADLYKKVKLWIAATFTNPNEVIKMDDFDSGVIKLTFNTPFIERQTLVESLQIDIKDDKYRYSFNNIYVPVEPQFQQNMTAEGINRRIREKTDKGKTPLKYLVNYVTTADMITTGMITSLNKAVNDDNF